MAHFVSAVAAVFIALILLFVLSTSCICCCLSGQVRERIADIAEFFDKTKIEMIDFDVSDEERWRYRNVASIEKPLASVMTSEHTVEFAVVLRLPAPDKEVPPCVIAVCTNYPLGVASGGEQG
ncbi:hypothetical protein DL96DRAFT_1045472 [Flagelloscypha sp. PMI_526]|nr:hypothetical protein DL96DRAFT_1045472 [Flagelloscypha sp. PMI_526]